MDKDYQIYEEIKALIRKHKPDLSNTKYDKFIKALVEVLDL